MRRSERKIEWMYKSKLAIVPRICVQVCSRRVLISLHVHRLFISLLIEFSSKTEKRNITKKKINPVLLFLSRLTSLTVIILVSKRVALSWRKTDFGQSIWPAGDQLITAFTILNCLEYEFLKGFLVQGRQQSFWKFSILSNILDLQWCLPNKWKIHSQLSAMFTCRDGKGGKLSSQASKMLYTGKPLGTVYIAHIRNRSTNQIAGNPLFSSEIILINN